MNEESLQEKQKYLSAEILEANFDPEQFQDFMMNNSNKQLDLHQWSLQQLKNIVKAYRKYKRNEQEQQENRSSLLEQYEEQNKIVNQQKNKARQDRQTYKLQDQNDDAVSVVPSINTSLYKHFAFRQKVNLPEIYVLIYKQNKGFHITVTNFCKTKPNNIFKSPYILYEIETTEKWKVKRRFTDFLWLHKNLAKAYPGLPIPPIPSKTTMRSFDEKHLVERMQTFQRFLNTLTYMPEICSDPILEIFLRGDDQYFVQAKKKFEASALSNYQTCTVDSIWGDELVLAEQSCVQSSTMNQYNDMRKLYYNISQRLGVLETSLKKASDDSFMLASDFEKAYSSCKNLKNNGIVSVFQEFISQIGDNLLKTSQYLKKSLSQSWNYESMYAANLSQYMAEIKKQQLLMTQKYKSAMLKVPDSGPDAFTNNFQPNKTIKEYQIAKEEYKIKLSYIVREMKRFEKQNLGRMADQWARDIKTYIGEVNKLAINSVDQLTRTFSIIEGKDLMEVQYIKK